MSSETAQTTSLKCMSNGHQKYVGFVLLMEMTMKNVVFWVVMPSAFTFLISCECFPLSHSHNTETLQQHLAFDEHQAQQPF
jgi:hypothetical protein